MYVTVGRDEYELKEVVVQIWENPEDGTVPLYGYFNPDLEKHFFTTDFDKYGIQHNGFILESIVGFVFDKIQKGLSPIYHFQANDTGDVYTPTMHRYINNHKIFKLIGIIGYACFLPPPTRVIHSKETIFLH